MIDGINTISPKNKSFENGYSDDPFPDSEPYEKEIFDNVSREDRFCAQHWQSRIFKPTFKGVRTGIESIPDPTEISNVKKNHDINYTQALTCRHCKVAVVAEVTISVYDLDPYVDGEKVKHRHPADTETVGEVLERITTERRLMEEWDPGDYVYSVKRNRGGRELGW